MEKKYTERLEQVVRVLKELPKEKKFNLTTFMTCGTTACACGWAGTDPWFRRRGFRTGKFGTGRHGYSVFYREFEGMEATRKFFGIDFGTSRHLFLHEEGKDGSKRAVIRRLKSFIKEQRN